MRTTTWLADVTNTCGVPNRSSPASGDRVARCEQVLAPRFSRHTTTLPLPLVMPYATTRAPFGSMATPPPAPDEAPILNGLSSGCGFSLTPVAVGPANGGGQGSPANPAHQASSSAMAIRV